MASTHRVTPRALAMLAILTFSTAAGSARAQTVVVVGTRTPESVQRSTIRTGVVTREEAERRGARNVGEALAGEASLQVNPEAYGYLGRPAGVQMQGLDAERVLVLEDGERVNGDVGGVVDLSRLSLTDVERIEYVTGPTSSLYGTNALGGVINVVTAPPRFQGLSGRGRFEGRSRGDLLAESSVAFRRDDDWAVADLGLEHSPAAPVGAGRLDTLVPRIDGRTLGLRLGTTLHRRAALRLKLRWVHDELWGLTSEQVPGLGVYLVDLPGTTDRVTARAQESLRLSPRARLDFSLGRSWYSGESRRDRQSSPVDEARRRALDTQSFESVLTLEDGGARTWIFGVRSDTEQFAQDLERTEVSSGALQTRRTPEVSRTQLASGALFAQLAWRFKSELTLLPGVRGELHDRYGGILAPRLAVAARPSEKVSVRAAFGRGFRAPSAKEYGFVFDHSAIGYRVLGNPALHPERSWGATVDVSYKPWRELLVRAGAFGNRVSQLISTNLAPNQPNPGVTDYTYVNVSRAKTAGADAQLRWRPHERYGVEGGYAYLWTRDDSTGEPLPNRPSHTVTLALNATPSSRLQGTLRYRWVAPSFVATDVRSPGFHLLDARVALSVWRDVQLYSGVSNLLNQKKDPGLVGDARPALGRSFYLGVRGNLPGSEEGNDAPN